MSLIKSLTKSYAARCPRQGLLINLCLLASMGLLVYGVQAPILTLQKFYFFNNTVSLWSALNTLAAQAEWGLFALVGAFSVAFPAIKILLLALVWNFDSSDGRRHALRLKWLAEYSKWSMLDVFVVALLVVSIKLGVLAEAHVEPGIYAFAASVMLTMVVSNWIGRHAH